MQNTTSTIKTRAAVCIQRHVRGYFIRHRLQQEHKSATTIQRFYRGHQVRIKMARTLQLNPDSTTQELSRRVSRQAQATIKWNEHRYQILRSTHASRISTECGREKERAAIRLQAWWRGVLCRRLHQTLMSRRSLNNQPDLVQDSHSSHKCDLQHNLIVATVVEDIVLKLRQPPIQNVDMEQLKTKFSQLDAELNLYYDRNKPKSRSQLLMTECQKRREHIQAMLQRAQAIGSEWQGEDSVINDPIHPNVMSRWRHAHLDALRAAKQPWWKRVPESLYSTKKETPTQYRVDEWINEINQGLEPSGRIF
ncbi:hypothetical protein BATDEDRAFT_28200 [Batrachochytrium dendrobatidis JAM81]|uniref:Uncharacterized protein n=1 Tax=Batrachochytrium dendrobatidis (strain JAM81 / FGSC 10211) TaxID=684364 RepID=F4PD99_BATDJ|nr:uncharacterized protein BATDEDRAFT_28200 [Batrachochytrium dendrobatidis JAM81]EGF76752.1 hypothetical protein BATDEDRAFT_28200 [Batrachochytrium dendrobatidis JAM81]|eukprot:XP_006682588.1 hypothetical protein BATDEDRAFT_28200 [Batrachochytrium dendrobatidis JAM81]